MSKSLKITKSKKLSKCGNLSKNNIIEESSFLNSNVKRAFNHLQLVFIKTPIFHHINLEYDIWIKTNTAGYTTDSMLSILAFKNKLDKVVTKNNLG